VKTKIGLRIFIIVIVQILLSLSVPLLSLAEEDREAEMNISVGSSFGKVTLRPKVKPFSAFKYKNIIKQGLDYSCGAASVATIFNYYLGEKISEENVIDGMFKVGNVDKIVERKGFSLLDMKKFAESMGYKAAGYRTDVEGLITLDKPSIVTIIIRDYKHFVIFKGVAEGRVFLADPALGNTTLLIEEFEKIWFENAALVIEPLDGKYVDGLKVNKEAMIMVSSDDLRRSLFYHSVLFPKGPREF
jgi:predicted double-glycine peptidase